MLLWKMIDIDYLLTFVTSAIYVKMCKANYSNEIDRKYNLWPMKGEWLIQLKPEKK